MLITILSQPLRVFFFLSFQDVLHLGLSFPLVCAPVTINCHVSYFHIQDAIFHTISIYSDFVTALFWQSLLGCCTASWFCAVSLSCGFSLLFVVGVFRWMTEAHGDVSTMVLLLVVVQFFLYWSPLTHFCQDFRNVWGTKRFQMENYAVPSSYRRIIYLLKLVICPWCKTVWSSNNNKTWIWWRGVMYYYPDRDYFSVTACPQV